jgi:7-cyano-7-deazaguanine synthase
MDKQRSVVLLSGGMDSAVAFYWAKKNTEIAAVINFGYGQRGAQYEFAAARALHQFVFGVGLDVPPGVPPLMYMHVSMPMSSPLVGYSGGLDPNAKDHHGQPITFVPGRNLIFIAFATSVAYVEEASVIVGGWNAIDVDYPDCTPGFLNAASGAATCALGRDVWIRAEEPGGYAYGLTVHSPVLRLTKAETVAMGESLGVPWEHTRSCYDAGPDPCLYCDSCVKRVGAFIKAGVRDPLVTDDDNVWGEFTWEWQDAQAYEKHDELLIERE